MKVVVSLVVSVVLIAVGGFAGFLIMKGISDRPVLGSSIETTNTRTIESISQDEQVVLVTLGIHGLGKKTASGEFFGQKIPGSEKTKFVEYSFYAKLGVDGKAVKIEKTGAGEYLVSVPKFIFIGHDQPTFSEIDANSGLLSSLAGDIDTSEMINEILNDQTKLDYLEENEQVLKDQVEAFYRGIAASIDPTVSLVFTYAA